MRQGHLVRLGSVYKQVVVFFGAVGGAVYRDAAVLRVGSFLFVARGAPCVRFGSVPHIVDISIHIYIYIYITYYVHITTYIYILPNITT